MRSRERHEERGRSGRRDEIRGMSGRREKNQIREHGYAREQKETTEYRHGEVRDQIRGHRSRRSDHSASRGTETWKTSRSRSKRMRTSSSASPVPNGLAGDFAEMAVTGEGLEKEMIGTEGIRNRTRHGTPIAGAKVQANLETEPRKYLEDSKRSGEAGRKMEPPRRAENNDAGNFSGKQRTTNPKKRLEKKPFPSFADVMDALTSCEPKEERESRKALRDGLPSEHRKEFDMHMHLTALVVYEKVKADSVKKNPPPCDKGNCTNCRTLLPLRVRKEYEAAEFLGSIQWMESGAYRKGRRLNTCTRDVPGPAGTRGCLAIEFHDAEMCEHEYQGGFRMREKDLGQTKEHTEKRVVKDKRLEAERGREDRQAGSKSDDRKSDSRDTAEERSTVVSGGSSRSKSRERGGGVRMVHKRKRSASSTTTVLDAESIGFATENRDCTRGNVVDRRGDKSPADRNSLKGGSEQKKREIAGRIKRARDVFAATESDSERAEALQSLIGCILDNDESIDVGQMESISQCIGTIMGNIVNPDVSVLPDPLSSDSLEEAFSAPIYVLFRCLIMTPEGDSSRQPLISIIAELREVIPCVTYLLLFFLKAGGKEATDMGVSAYKDVAAAIDHSTEEQLVDDLRECAIADIRLFSYLVSFVFAKFQPESTSSADLVKTVCTFTDGNILWSVLTDLVRENVTIFRKDTFPTIVSASLNWDTAEQLIFWQFVHAEGVNHEWCSSLFTRVDTDKHPEASTNLMLILKRIDREPNMVLMRAILTRLPKDGDDMVCNAIKILIEDPDVSEKVAEIFSSILKKQIQGGDFMMPPGNNQKLKSGQKLSMEQVLSHISYFSRQCLQKDSRVGETLLARSPIKEAFHAIKKCDKAAPLRARFSDLFTLIDILNEDVDSQPSRTLRGRQTKAHPTTPKRESKGNSEDEPRSKRHKPIVLDDSDSDE